jgi:cytochrome c biogenesis protein ResB
VEINHPLRVAGYSLFQTGYDPNDLSWTSLQVVCDPGVPLVYAGLCFLIAGLFSVFYLNPWLEWRRAHHSKNGNEMATDVEPSRA